MKRFEFLASVAVALGLGKLFPSLLRPATALELEPYTVKWDVEPVSADMVMTEYYWNGDDWVEIASAPAHEKTLTGFVPKGCEGPYKMKITYG